jgi:small subunit ribosomal protein S11
MATPDTKPTSAKPAPAKNAGKPDGKAAKTATKTAKPKAGSGAATKGAAIVASRKSRKVRRTVTHGHVYVQATYNNTIVTITDKGGDTIGWSSSGAIGFKGAKKSTPYAAGQVVHNLMDRLEPVGLREVEVFVNGIGSGREAAIRAFQARGVNVSIIKDVTPIPHNGVRAKKQRRV